MEYVEVNYLHIFIGLKAVRLVPKAEYLPERHPKAPNICSKNAREFIYPEF
jgi:hypothetical protein